MTDSKLSLPEIAALVVLMVEAGEISNPDLRKRHGITLDGRARLHLNELKLVDSWKQGRAYVHVLTDAGWARVAEEFRAGTVTSTGSPWAMARALMGGLQEFMERTDRRLADVFGPASDAEALIREAYAELVLEPGGWVSLTELRVLLRDVTRSKVDETLRRMAAMPDVNIVPESNQKALRRRDREAALVIGDQDKHLISIGA
ncbi:hypothetical protein [Planotetraspora kaengkrachanensis]|uniref:Uncharacterized protein n=1 Tax=Planotetraspora kaengkrachanensis TaxID=575193 RepID=A0A8J3PZI6_9ACTN|nr:hypothetical protein [Planotetraspora kaengkrachanensis]GIG83979.1 hypothetical protein Pka01_71060 [Planotetraspora kaengkrachanensis]